MARLVPTHLGLALLAFATTALAQPGQPGGRGGDDGFRGPGGLGGMSQQEIELVEEHDRNGDGWLNEEERAEARKALAERRVADGRRGRPFGGGRSPRGGNREPAAPGPSVLPSEVRVYDDALLYDVNALRTIFLNFKNEDWEAELQDFYGTDVDVPATMIVDGRSYANVGVHFRGASSYMMVPAGYKRSLNVAMDFVKEDQRLYGYKTLNLLNCAGDASMMSTVLYSQIADAHLAVPKANFAKVVINGEYWGVYVNAQQFDKIFTAEQFGSSKGTRWKVPGSPRGDAGLAYDGEDLEPYRARYEMKSNDGKKAWNALVELCRVLDETPADRLVEELSPILDIDETLWFLAYDVAFVNRDGYWTRLSDYGLFRDAEGRFHLIPHDVNEAFRGAQARGPGGFGGPDRPDGPGGPDGFGPPPGERRRGGGAGADRARRPGGGGGVDLDPLVGLDNERMPLRSRLLAVPALGDQYLTYVREIAEQALDWDQLGPQVAQYRSLIEDAVEQDTRKLETYESFLRVTTVESIDGENGPDGSLQSFARLRRAYLRNYEPPEGN